jgi:hypothetical protein
MAKAFMNGFIPNTCGVGVSSMFRGAATPGGYNLETMSNPGGAGWHVAGFTPESAAYKEAYNDLKKKWKIVMQTPVRTNTRTGYKFIFVVYDTKSRLGAANREVHNSQFDWPW